MEGEGISTIALREITLLKKFDHENIIKLHKYIIVNNYIYLIFDLITSDLRQYLKHKKLDPKEI